MPLLSKTSAIRKILFVSFSCILFFANLPLGKQVYGLQLWTPYFPFFLSIALLIHPKLLPRRRVLKRHEERIFISVQFLIILLVFFTPDPSISYSASLVALYTASLYWLARYYFRIQVITSYNLMRCAVIIFIVLTIVALLQILLQKNIGVLASYFGQNMNEGIYALEQGKFRVSSTFFHPNTFSQAYALYSSIIISFLLFSREKITHLYLAMLLSCVMLGITAASLSRGGLLNALLLQTGIYTLWLLRGGRAKGDRILAFLFIIVSGLLTLVMTISLIPGDIIPGVSRLINLTMEDRSIYTRVVVYKGAVQLLLNDINVFFWGTGQGQFFARMAENGIFPDYRSYIPPHINRGSAHNWFLMVTTENGFIVMITYFYSVYKIILRGWSLRKLPGGWLSASLAIIVATFYIAGFQIDTTSMTVWLLTPVTLLLAWIQNEYDLLCYKERYQQRVTRIV